MTLDLVGLETYPERIKSSSTLQKEGECVVLIMGRWKRKKEAKKKSQRVAPTGAAAGTTAAATAVGGGGGGDGVCGVAPLLDAYGDGVVFGVEEEDDEKTRDWTWQERNDLSRYLDDYRIGCCEQFHLATSSEQQQEQHDVWIGGYLFPALTKTVLQAPYMELPRNLTKKHRRMIHDVCVEAMLFHMTIVDNVETTTAANTTTCTTALPVVSMEQEEYDGDNNDDDNNDDDDDAQQSQQQQQLIQKNDGRYIVISIYADGFDGIPAYCQQQQQQQRRQDCDNNVQQLVHRGLNILQYKPWYCRNNKERHHDENSNNNNNDSTVSTSSTSTMTAMVAKARNDIDHLMDQPGECLREGKDEFDFEKWDGQDLSTIPPPTGNEDDDTSSSSLSSSSFLLVDSVDKMQQCITELQQALPNITELGFDLEAWNPSKYAQVTCLLQITTNLGRDYVIDTLAPGGVWDLIGPGLGPLFANANIVKVGHSIGGLDIRCLHRDFGIIVVNVFDTYEASKVLQLSSHGLASVCAHYGLLLHENEEYTNLKATYQTCDWRRRPLTQPMIRYGRYDVHYLLQLRHLMMRDLTRQDLWDITPVQHDATSRLVAAALQKTLAQFAQEDDDDYYYHDNANYKNDDNDNNQDDDDDDENADKPDPNEANDSRIHTAADDDDDDVPPPDTAAIGTIDKEEENGQGDDLKKQQDCDPNRSDNDSAKDSDDDDDGDDGNEAFYTPKGSVRSLGTGQVGLKEDSDDDDGGGGRSLLFRTPVGSTRNLHDGNESEENDSHENDDVGDEENGNDREPIASVPVLRLQPKLMAVLSQSQERCRDLWSGRSEPASNTRTLLNIQRRAKQQRIRQNNKKRQLKNNGSTTVEEHEENSTPRLLLPDWTEQNDKLYHALVAWRDQVAREWEVLPGLVIPLDMLVPIAWQCPQTRAELQRIRFDLPGIFFYNNGQYMNELLDLVKREFPLTAQNDHDANNDNDHYGNKHMIYLYANRASAVGPKLSPPPPPPPKEENDTNGPSISIAVTPNDNNVANDIVKDEEKAPPTVDVKPMPAAAAARSSTTFPTAAAEARVIIPTARAPPTDDDGDDDDDGERGNVSEDSIHRWHRVAWIVAGVAVIVLIAVRTTSGSRHRGRR